MISVDGRNSFILGEEQFEKGATLLALNKGVDLLDEP
jgi:hypothetical protein